MQEIKNRIRAAVKAAAKEKGISQDLLLEKSFKGGSGLFFNNVGEKNQDIKVSFLLTVCEITGKPCSYFLHEKCYKENTVSSEAKEIELLYETLALKQKIIELQATQLASAPSAPKDNIQKESEEA